MLGRKPKTKLWIIVALTILSATECMPPNDYELKNRILPTIRSRKFSLAIGKRIIKTAFQTPPFPPVDHKRKGILRRWGPILPGLPSSIEPPWGLSGGRLDLGRAFRWAAAAILAWSVFSSFPRFCHLPQLNWKTGKLLSESGISRYR